MTLINPLSWGNELCYLNIMERLFVISGLRHWNKMTHILSFGRFNTLISISLINAVGNLSALCSHCSLAPGGVGSCPVSQLSDCSQGGFTVHGVALGSVQEDGRRSQVASDAGGGMYRIFSTCTRTALEDGLHARYSSPPPCGWWNCLTFTWGVKHKERKYIFGGLSSHLLIYYFLCMTSDYCYIQRLRCAIIT